jgi:LPS export ABC transporter protein LptC
MALLGNIRLVLAIFVTTAIVGITAVVSLKGAKPAFQGAPLQQLPQNIDVALRKARFTEMRDGAALWELVADRAEYNKSGDVAYLTGVRMEFAKTRSSGAITVTAVRGEYSSKSRNVALRGAVHVETETGMSFDTESIDYQASRSVFKTAEQVSFRHQRLTLAARGMELNVKDQKARFHKAIDATVASLQQSR